MKKSKIIFLACHFLFKFFSKFKRNYFSEIRGHVEVIRPCIAGKIFIKILRFFE